MVTTEPSTFGAVLSRYRVAAGLTQEELAERAGLSVEAISTLERGVVRRLRVSTLRQLLDALQLSPDDRSALELAVPGALAVRAEDMPLVGSFLGALPTVGMVGRGEELGRIRSVLDAVTEGAGHCLLLGGELGVGKTRLLQEIMVEARSRGHLVLTARYYQAEQTTSFYPVIGALSEGDTLVPPAMRSEWQRGWKRIRAGDPEGHGGTAPTVGRDNTTVGAAGTQAELFGAVSDLLTSVARSRPTTLLFDDLQWADGDTLKLLAHLARATRTSPILLCGAFLDHRVGEEHPALADGLQVLSRERLSERLVLRRLSLEETTQVVAVIMGSD